MGYSTCENKFIILILGNEFFVKLIFIREKKSRWPTQKRNSFSTCFFQMKIRLAFIRRIIYSCTMDRVTTHIRFNSLCNIKRHENIMETLVLPLTSNVEKLIMTFQFSSRALHSLWNEIKRLRH